MNEANFTALMDEVSANVGIHGDAGKISTAIKQFLENEIAFERSRIIEGINHIANTRFKHGETNSAVVIKACKDVVMDKSKW